jgi:hypothetical protein
MIQLAGLRSCPPGAIRRPGKNPPRPRTGRRERGGGEDDRFAYRPEPVLVPEGVLPEVEPEEVEPDPVVPLPLVAPEVPVPLVPLPDPVVPAPVVPLPLAPPVMLLICANSSRLSRPSLFVSSWRKSAEGSLIVPMLPCPEVLLPVAPVLPLVPAPLVLPPDVPVALGVPVVPVVPVELPSPVLWASKVAGSARTRRVQMPLERRVVFIMPQDRRRPFGRSSGTARSRN